MSAQRRSDYSYDDACYTEKHAVFGQHPDTKDRTERQPPARVSRFAEANKEVGRYDPPQVVKRDVLHEAATPERKRHGRERCQEHCPATTAQFPRQQTCHHHASAGSQCGEKAESGKRSAEKAQRDPSKKRSHRRISDITPRQVARVIQRRELVSMEPVTPTSQDVGDQHHSSQAEDQKQPAPSIVSRELHSATVSGGATPSPYHRLPARGANEAFAGPASSAPPTALRRPFTETVELGHARHDIRATEKSIQANVRTEVPLDETGVEFDEDKID